MNGATFAVKFRHVINAIGFFHAPLDHPQNAVVGGLGATIYKKIHIGKLHGTQCCKQGVV